VKESTSYYRISDLSASDRPRERLAEKGAEALQTPELLAILLRTGIAGENAVQLGQRILNDFKGLTGLHKASFAELASQRGVGVAKAAQIKAAIELGRRLPDDEKKDPVVYLNKPEDAAGVVQYEMAAFTQEHLWVMLADTRNRLISIEKLYKGTLNASNVRIGELFRPAIVSNAAAILLVHNHPSGDASASADDHDLTERLRAASELVGVLARDHVIVASGGYFSFVEAGRWRR
jgi:DNA repair protein RadC